jgi:hypothetical protein
MSAVDRERRGSTNREEQQAEQEDIGSELILDNRVPEWGKAANVSSTRSKVMSFYRWLLQAGLIKRDPAAVHNQLSFSWDVPTA